MKTCTACNKSLPEDFFYSKQNQCKACKKHKSDEYRQKRIASGVCPKCGSPASGGILCERCRDRSYQRQRKSRSITEREKIINAAPLNTRYCSLCELYLPLNDFYHWDTRRISRCKTCKRSEAIKSRERKIKSKKCIHCGDELDEKNSPTCRSCKRRNLERYYKNKDKYRATKRIRNFQLRMDAFNAYGGPICACCGETEFKFLSIDHIDGEGAAHRKQMKKELGYVDSIYKWLKNNDYPQGPYQVLCYNCNLSKGHYGTCPHEVQTVSRSEKKEYLLSHEDLFSLKVEVERLKFKIDQWIKPHRTLDS